MPYLPKDPTTSRRLPSKSLTCEPLVQQLFKLQHKQHSGLFLSPSSTIFVFFREFWTLQYSVKDTPRMMSPFIHSKITLKQMLILLKSLVSIQMLPFILFSSFLPSPLSLPLYSFSGTSAHSCVMHVQPLDQEMNSPEHRASYTQAPFRYTSCPNNDSLPLLVQYSAQDMLNFSHLSRLPQSRTLFQSFSIFISIGFKEFKFFIVR